MDSRLLNVLRYRLRGIRPVRLATGILLAGILLQTYVLTSGYLAPWGKRIWDLRTRTAWERTGLLSPWFGEDRTEFLAFIQETTSIDSVIIFTNRTGPYGWRPVLQYFLFPRTVVLCPESGLNGCLGAYPGDGSYLVYLEGRPQPEDIPADARFIPFGAIDGAGLYQLSVQSDLIGQGASPP